MALRQSTLNFGQGQVLGKRSREPFAELTPNVPAKRSQPAPDLHPGEDEDKPSDETSSDFKQALEDIIDNKIFDVDEEDVVEDSTKATDQAKQHADWFRHCEETDGLSSLYPDERR